MSYRDALQEYRKTHNLAQKSVDHLLLERGALIELAKELIGAVSGVAPLVGEIYDGYLNQIIMETHDG